MGKKTGFMDFGRETQPARPPEERLVDWAPIHLSLSTNTLQEQAARCMDCGLPYCHGGAALNGMGAGCPIHNLIPEWNDLVYRGLWREAYERLAKTNNFPEFTGLVCPAPCEAACTVGLVGSPVAIKSIEYALIDRAFAEGWVEPAAPRQRTGRRVAIVGSGPAGLACADQLSHVGHSVTVFERAPRVGGLLTYGIPPMKLDKALVERRVALLAAGGVEFVTNTAVGGDGGSYPARRLQSDFDAVVLCTGATRPRDLPVPGRDLTGVHFATDFLSANVRRLLNGPEDEDGYISAKGKDVIVIGGGDTGTDCVATALRHGCRGLVQFEILLQPPLQRAPDNPWPQWPRIFCQDYGQEEAVARFGADPRRFAVMTTGFLGDGNGQLAAVETVDVAWQPAQNGHGRPSPQAVPGSERTWPAQLVLLAMGFLGPEQALLAELDIARDERSNILAPASTYATSVPGVFAAGDARRGQSLVVWAIQEGRAAAKACDRYLMGETDLP